MSDRTRSNSQLKTVDVVSLAQWIISWLSASDEEPAEPAATVIREEELVEAISEATRLWKNKLARHIKETAETGSNLPAAVESRLDEFRSFCRSKQQARFLGMIYAILIGCLSSGNLDWLNGGVECSRRRLLPLAAEHSPEPSQLAALGALLDLRFQRLGQLIDSDRAIEYHQRAVELTPAGHAERPSRLDNLGNSWLSRFDRLGDLADSDRAMECYERAVKLTPDGHADRPRRLNDIGASWSNRFERLGDLADLERAIECHEQAIELTPDNHVDKPVHLSNLGASWYLRFGRLGHLADWDRAIKCHERAVELTPDGHADMPARLNNLGVSWSTRFLRLGDPSDLERAIECHERAIENAPEDQANKPVYLSNLASSLSLRFDRLGDLVDSDRAIVYHERAVELTPEDQAIRPTCLNNFGVSWLSRFQRLGDLSDLDQAITCYERAAELTPDSHADKPTRLDNLGGSRSNRFERLGDIADLERAIECHERVIKLTPDGHADKPARLNNLGVSSTRRFERLGHLTDSDRAIECHEQATELTPNGHANKPVYLSNLGGSWSNRFERLDELSDLKRAIECHERATELTPDGHADKPARLNNLGGSWSFLFGRLGDLADSERAIVCHERAVKLTPEGHANKPGYQSNLGNLWFSRFSRTFKPVNLELAELSFQRCADYIVTAPGIQIRSACRWAFCSRLLGSSPLPAYQRAFALIPHYVWLGLTVQRRYDALATISDLTTDAAAWAISVELYDLAIEWLEAGRTIVWNQILQLRTPLDNLAAVNSGLATRLNEIASQLERAGTRPVATASDSSESQADLESQARSHRRQAAQWERCLKEARKLPGFENFLLPRKAQELKKAAAETPVVMINTHKTRCDALVIFPQREDVVHIPLDKFSHAKSRELRIQVNSLVGYRGRGDEPRGFKRGAASSSDPLAPLKVLWSDVVGPVLKVLAYELHSTIDELPHVTWCATGALSFLPLHAAGPYDGSSPNALDLVVSSYTPTLGAMIDKNPRVNVPQAGVLAVGQATSLRGLSALPKTVEEIAIVQQHVQMTHYTQLDGHFATVDATLNAMESHSWIHLACHATQNRTNPSHSAFHLHDGDLTLETITKRAFKNKGLAFLSACQTATGDDDLPDEATHLAAGMLMAGYPSVIATMWSINDEDGPIVAEGVYAELLKHKKMDYKGAARALHKTVMRLRERVGVRSIGRWAPFIQIGI